MTRLMPALAAACALTGFVAPIDALAQIINPEQFAQIAATSNEFEIHSSKLALQKSQSGDVKQFAERMIADHTALGNKMQNALTQAKIKAPNEQLDAKHQQLLTQLQKLHGSNFDRQFIMDQINAHQEAINLLRQYSTRGGSEPLKQWATNGLPTIEHHYQMAKTLEKDHNLSASR